MKALRTLYWMLANSMILLALTLVGAHLFGRMYFQFHGNQTPQYRSLPDAVKRNYAHMAPQDVDELLQVTESMRMRYVPWTGFSEETTRSRFVNVDARGIRANGTASRDISSIEGAIWFFGGSTAFGYGVADAETIPARLEKLLARPVVNFGVAYFFSAQENLLLNRYLRIGYRPSMALFFDGINEACDVDDYQDEMKILFANAQLQYDWDILELARPVARGLRRVAAMLRPAQSGDAAEPGADGLVCENRGRKAPLRAVHARILAEREALCRLYDVRCVTFVQPFAGLHGKHEDRSGVEPVLERLRNLFLHLEPNWRAAKSVFVTDALDAHPEHAYVDAVHYSAGANAAIARAIAGNLRESPR